MKKRPKTRHSASPCKRDALPTELSAHPSGMAAFRPILKRVSAGSRNGAGTNGAARDHDSRNSPEMLDRPHPYAPPIIPWSPPL